MKAKLGLTKVAGIGSKECANGKGSCPTILCLVANGLLEAPNVGDVCLVWTDDFLILIKGMGIEAAMDVMLLSFKRVGRWCESMGLSVNPEKIDLVVFTCSTENPH